MDATASVGRGPPLRNDLRGVARSAIGGSTAWSQFESAGSKNLSRLTIARVLWRCVDWCGGPKKTRASRNENEDDPAGAFTLYRSNDTRRVKQRRGRRRRLPGRSCGGVGSCFCAPQVINRDFRLERERKNDVRKMLCFSNREHEEVWTDIPWDCRWSLLND